ncbi:hypothetical protein ACFPK9_07085 [Rubritalea spongiae]|uniref:Uncharacterized protein n=1 Tax=Rubritalea spongiae TaxID=430797 RepID=A0ABW5E1D7_9BACT
MPKKATEPPPKSRAQRAVLVVFFLMCSAITIGLSLWLFQDELRLPQLVAKMNKHQPQPERYELLTEDLKIRKLRLKERYLAADTIEQKDKILSESRALLESVLPEMMRCWLGTPWDFNGYCEKPGSGKIACGYFVSTVMRDAGFKLNRIKLAQQPSQTILNAFVPRGEMNIRTGMHFDTFWDMLADMDQGIYIIGLDKHVGFMVHDGTQLRSIHSSGSIPWCVVDESRENADSIKRSHYRVVGNLTAQDSTILGWLLDKEFF